MTRLIPAVLVTLLVVALCTLHHRDSVTEAATPPVAGMSVRAVEGYPPVALSSHRTSRPHRLHCTDTHWRSFLKPAERWIDQRESRMDPAAVEPTTGAEEIGQLLPSTLANLGLTYSTDPCTQIRHQRIYKTERYGSWANAKAHWRRWLWW